MESVLSRCEHPMLRQCQVRINLCNLRIRHSSSCERSCAPCSSSLMSRTCLRNAADLSFSNSRAEMLWCQMACSWPCSSGAIRQM